MTSLSEIESRLINWLCFTIETVRVTDGAATKLPLPACAATTRHAPATRVSVKVLPLTVQMPVSNELNVTPNPDEAVATKGLGASVVNIVAAGVKLIVWVCRTLNKRVTSPAAL